MFGTRGRVGEPGALRDDARGLSPGRPPVLLRRTASYGAGTALMSNQTKS
jgi:hypothetical protein